MSYKVLARLYRPQTFEEVTGQEHIVTTLSNAITENKIAHAYLFGGPRGVGKTSMARLLAKALNCQKGPTATPCNKCEICKSITDSMDPDVLEMDAASNRGIDEIRTLREGVGYVPLRARYKVYILDEAHQLSRDAFNALLKTLEEPPPHVIFIFATTEPQRMPDTIISRCQRFYFRRISTKDILTRLNIICKKEGFKCDAQVLTNIAQSVAGSMRDAEGLLDQLVSYRGNELISLKDLELLSGTVTQQEIMDLFDCLIKNELAGVIRITNKIFSEGKDISVFLEHVTQHVWYLIVAGIAPQDDGLLQAEVIQDKERYVKQSSQIGLPRLIQYSTLLSEAKRNLKDTANPRVLLELTLIKLTQLNPSETPVLVQAVKMDRVSVSKPALITAVPVPATVAAPVPVLPQEAEEPSEQPTAQLTDEIKNIWAKVVEQVKAKSIKVHALLREGRFVQADNTEVVVGFAKSCNFHRGLLDEPKHKHVVEDVIQELTGRRLALTLSILPGGNNEPDEELSENGTVKKNDLLGRVSERSSAPADEPSFDRDEKAREALKDPAVQKLLETFEGRIAKVEG